MVFGVGEGGGGVGLVAGGEQVDVVTGELTGGVRLGGGGHRRQVAGASHQCLGPGVAHPGLAGEAGAGGFGAVVGPDLAVVPPVDHPAVGGFQA